MLDTLRYFILRALRNMRQWPFLCAAAILTMAVALTTVATFFLIVVNIEQLAQHWTREIELVVYLEQPPAQDLLPQLMEQLRHYPEVESVSYISQAQAMKNFRRQLGENGSLLDGVDPELLPASFELGLKAEFRHAAGIRALSERLEGLLEIDDLRYGQEWLDRFNHFVGMLRFIGMVLGGFLLLAALFIVSNTIRLTLYARRDELEIMALVGATMKFIKLPFLLEGAIQGLLGGIMALFFLVLSGNLILARGLNSFWLVPAEFQLLFLSFGQQLALIGAGIVLGFLGSLTSLRRFVRV